MAQDKSTFPNIDNSNLAAYPDGQIKDNTGSGDGTPISQLTNSDIQEFFSKLLRMAGIAPNGGFDNEVNGFQFVDAARALAGKNDIIRSITTVGGQLSVDTKLNSDRLNQGEFFLAKPGTDHTTETTITGIDTTTLSLIATPSYKAGDILLMVILSGGVQLFTLATSSTLGRMADEIGYLLAATNAQEFAGTATNKATTPASNKAAFKRRVNGDGTVDDSGDYLATQSQNGLLSKEDKIKIDIFAARNKGYISGVDCGGLPTGTNLPVSGNISSAVVQAGGGINETLILVTLQNAMNGTAYLVKMYLESLGNISFDDDCLAPVFKTSSSTQFTIAIQEANGAGSTVTQNIRIHIEANNL